VVLSEQLVRAAGGLVFRPAGHGRAEILLVHRAQYDDWGFPKGKNDPGESDEDCALREVEEETGHRCVIERELGETSYRDAKDRGKIVRYYVMRALSGSFTPHEEIDDARWVPVEDAAGVLTYERDRELLARSLVER
jgi:8-oxo-dGTP diphosphatase